MASGSLASNLTAGSVSTAFEAPVQLGNVGALLGLHLLGFARGRIFMKYSWTGRRATGVAAHGSSLG
jgi:hypothetical protein